MKLGFSNFISSYNKRTINPVLEKGSSSSEVDLYLFEKKEKNTKGPENLKTKLGYINFSRDLYHCYSNSNFFIGAPKVNCENEFDLELFGTEFLEFADLQIYNKEKLFDFIKNMGFLTNGSEDYNTESFKKIVNLSGNNEILASSVWCEPISVWFLFQNRLRTLIRVWRSLEDGGISPIQKYPKSTDFHDIYNMSYKFYESLQDESILSIKGLSNDLNFNYSPRINLKNYMNEKYDELIKKDGKIPAGLLGIAHRKMRKNQTCRYFLRDFLIEQLEELLNISSPNLKVYYLLKESRNLMRDKNTLNSKNNNLMDILIQQFANSVILGLKFTRCLECQKWIAKTSSIPKIYCNYQCRNNAYKRRKELSLIYDFADPMGALSIANVMQQFVKSLLKDNRDLASFSDYIDKHSPSKQVGNIFFKLASNMLGNVSRGATKNALSVHYNIKEELIPNLISGDHAEAFLIKYHLPFNSYANW